VTDWILQSEAVRTGIVDCALPEEKQACHLGAVECQVFVISRMMKVRPNSFSPVLSLEFSRNVEYFRKELFHDKETED
jgi:hypothetical protein